MAKKRKIRSDEPASTGAPLPEQLQTLTEPASTGAPLPEQLQTLTEPEQPAQQIEIKSQPQMEQDHQTKQPEVGLVVVQIEESVKEQPPQSMNEEPQKMNEDVEEDKEKKGSVIGYQTVKMDGGGKDESDEKLDEEPIEKILEHFGKDQLIAIVKESVSKFPDVIEIVKRSRSADFGPAHRTVIETVKRSADLGPAPKTVIETVKRSADLGPAPKTVIERSADLGPAPKTVIETVKRSADLGPAPKTVIETVKRLSDSDPAHRTICVHGLVLNNMETLIEVFRKYGQIEDCKPACDKESGKSIGYGFIIFKNRSAAMKALNHPQEKIGNRLISCQLSSAGFVPAPVGPPASDNIQRKICIYNVSADIDPLKLTKFFARYGEIEEGPLGLDKAGKFIGFCLFVYKTMGGYRKALQEPQKIFEGMILNCQESKKPHIPDHQLQRQNQQLSSKSTPGHLKAPSAPSLGFKPASLGFKPALGPEFGQALAAALLS